MSAITYAPDLVEEAVLLAERAMAAAEARRFRHQRNRLYEIEDADARERAFRALHVWWFARLGLYRPIDAAVAEAKGVLDRVSGCRVSRALSGRDEGADLVDPCAAEGRPGEARPMLSIRVRPLLLMDPASLRQLLAHELMHVADMLDPAFLYERSLPSSGEGPSMDNLVRERYRVLWDVTIDGRLARRGRARPGSRALRQREFTVAFGTLSDRAAEIFDDWFDRVRPTHPELVAAATTRQFPSGGHHENVAGSGRHDPRTAA
jgi:hypothetical protein